MLDQLKAFLNGARHLGKRALPVAVLLAVAAASAGAYSGAAKPVNHGRRRPTFTLSARPATVSALPGATVRYTITIRRRHFRRRISFTIAKPLPRGFVVSRLPVRSRARRVALTVHTSALMRPGRYRLLVRARAGRLTRTVTLKLTITAPVSGSAAAGQSPAFSLSGDITAPLEPGVLQPLDLRITNPNPAPLIVARVDVLVQAVAAPEASATLPCSAGDFGVQQFSGSLPLTIPASSTRSLAQLGVPTAGWPQVALLDLPTNQDGCQGARLTLAYQATARLG